MELQTVELHFDRKPEFREVELKSRVEAILGDEIEFVGADRQEHSLHIAHKNHVVEYKEGGRVPAQTVIFRIQKELDKNDYNADIQQSWATPNAGELLTGSTYTVLVTEMMARALPPKDRLTIFHGVLQALMELARPIALVFKHSQQVIDPAKYIQALDGPMVFRPGALNVRFFCIENSAGDMLMDTRGLNEIGLHDLQCHFRGLEPNDVVALLMNTALYIYDHGEVIESGNTIAGIGEGSKYVCRFEDALAQPNRVVLDINPGPPYAAGNR
jgi:hypothetical protein